MKTLFFSILLIFVNLLGYSQKNVDGYIAGSIQFARNKKNFTGSAHQWKSSYSYPLKGLKEQVNTALHLKFKLKALQWDFIEWSRSANYFLTELSGLSKSVNSK